MIGIVYRLCVTRASSPKAMGCYGSIASYSRGLDVCAGLLRVDKGPSALLQKAAVGGLLPESQPQIRVRSFENVPSGALSRLAADLSSLERDG